MDSDKVQRFISREDWISLLAPKAAPVYPRLKQSEVWQDLAAVQKDLTDIRSTLEAVKRRGADLFKLPTLQHKIKQERLRHRKHLRRIRELAQPKSSPSGKGSSSDFEESPVGPGDYEVSLDIARPSFLSTIPKQPIPCIREWKRSDKAFSCKAEIARMRGMDAPACTAYSPNVDLLHKTPTKVSIAGRSASHSRITPDRESTLLRSRLNDLQIETDQSTVSLLRSAKCKYSIPRSVRKLDIRKCKSHTVSLQNRLFNHSFATPQAKASLSFL